MPPTPDLPEALLRYAAPGATVVEVAAGNRFDLALQFARAAEGVRVVVTDRDPKVLTAPPPLEARVDDLWRPDPSIYQGAALVYGQRIPEELQAAAAAVARRVGAAFAHRPLKDELADVTDAYPGPARLLPGGWRLHVPA